MSLDYLNLLSDTAFLHLCNNYAFRLYRILILMTSISKHIFYIVQYEYLISIYLVY